MGQSRNSAAGIFFFLIATVALLLGCRQKSPVAAASQPTSPPHVKVASLVPAATDLLLGMGAADHLVAVSNQEPADVSALHLPHVGDYQATDWEMLASLRPQVMIIQIAPSHLPPGFTQHAAELNIQLINIQLNTLDDVLEGARSIGQAVGEPEKGAALSSNLRSRLDALKRKWASAPRVKTLLTLDETAEALAGPHTFLDDLLQCAGGENAAAPLKSSWPKVDHETVLTLKPQVVIEIKPSAPPATLERAKAFWARLGGNPQVYLIREPYGLLPGAHVADLAEEMSRCLHAGGEAQP